MVHEQSARKFLARGLASIVDSLVDSIVARWPAVTLNSKPLYMYRDDRVQTKVFWATDL